MDSCNSSGFDTIPKDLDSSQRPDRLSELPDSLIISILSLLSMIDVVQTTILSKRWKDLWATIPCLDFTIRDQHFKYVDFISGALAKWRGAKMLKFSLHLSLHLSLHPDISFDSVIRSWLLFAIEKQVEEFSVDLYTYGDDVAPQRLYSCSSIRKLSLAFFGLQIEDKVQWDNLKSLTLGIEEFLSEDALNQVLSGAPRLEELVLRFWNFSEVSDDLNISSTSLKTLKIEPYDDWRYYWTGVLGVWAPNLATLELSGLNCGGYSLVVPSLSNAILSLKERDWRFMNSGVFNHVFRSISHVEEFTLSEWCSKFLIYEGDTDVDPPLSNAKSLKLCVHEAEDILYVFDSFPKLMRVFVDQRDAEDLSNFVDQVPEQLDAADYDSRFCSCSVVELRRVEITWSVGDASVFQVMEYLLGKARKLEKMVLRLRMADGADSEAFVLAEEKVRSMPRSSPSVQLNITKIC